MRKHLIAAVLAIVMCLAALSGCSVVKVFEKDATVVFEVDGAYVDSVTVNAFNNAIAPVYDESTVPDGYKFMGWSAAYDWKYGDDRTVLITSGGIVRYDAVKGYLNEGGTAVARPVIIDKNTIPKSDLVIAWYDKDKTSGLTQSIMDAFEANLRAYLVSESYSVDDMDIVIRGYSGTVGTSCENIRKDDDVDIMVGWAAVNNLTNTGGMQLGTDILENVGGISINPETARYAARKTDTELCLKVYSWIQSEYGNETEPEYVYVPGAEESDPEPDPEQPDTPTEPTLTPIELPSDLGEPVSSTTLTVAWYNLEDTSGLNADYMAAFETKLKAYLETQGYNLSELDITVKGYEGDVATSCAAIKQDGNVDIMIGWAASSNLKSKAGWEEGKDFIVNYGDVTVGAKARYAVWLSNTDISKLVYIWMLCEYGEYSAPVPTLEFTETKLVLGWWSSSSSGLTQEVIANVENGLKDYLTAHGKDLSALEIEIRDIAGNVQPAGEIINNAGDFDIVMGFGGNLTTVPTEDKTGGNVTVKKENRLSGIEMGVSGKTKTGRYIDLLDDSNDFAVVVFEWFKTAEAQALFVIA